MRGGTAFLGTGVELTALMGQGVGWDNKGTELLELTQIFCNYNSIAVRSGRWNMEQTGHGTGNLIADMSKFCSTWAFTVNRRQHAPGHPSRFPDSVYISLSTPILQQTSSPSWSVGDRRAVDRYQEGKSRHVDIYIQHILSPQHKHHKNTESRKPTIILHI